jgi:hypothetical protein
MPVTVVAQATPNPNAMKFTVDRQVSAGTSRSYASAAAAAGDSLAARLFAIPRVKMVFLLNDFVTVTREPDGDWEAIAPAVEQALREHFA